MRKGVSVCGAVVRGGQANWVGCRSVRLNLGMYVEICVYELAVGLVKALWSSVLLGEASLYWALGSESGMWH